MPGRAAAGRADTGRVTTHPSRGRWSSGLVLGAVLAVALSVLAFVVLDVIIAVAVAVVLLTVVVLAFGASGWDEHSSYEEREQERARRRKEKWEQNADARERDRRRWEAHRAQRDGGTGTADPDR